MKEGMICLLCLLVLLGLCCLLFFKGGCSFGRGAGKEGGSLVHVEVNIGPKTEEAVPPAVPTIAITLQDKKILLGDKEISIREFAQILEENREKPENLSVAVTPTAAGNHRLFYENWLMEHSRKDAGNETGVQNTSEEK